MKLTDIIAFVWILFLGFIPGFLVSRCLLPPRPVVSVARDAPHYVAADNAIARFGLAPVNPDWIQVTHKSGAPIDGVPSHEWAVFTFAYEPKIEKIEQNGALLWKVTFEP
jgi:hypothetical protein